KPAWLAERPEKGLISFDIIFFYLLSFHLFSSLAPVPLTLANQKAKILHSKMYKDYYALKPGSKSFVDLKEELGFGDIITDEEEKNLFKELVRSVLEHIAKEYPNDFDMKNVKITDQRVYLER